MLVDNQYNLMMTAIHFVVVLQNYVKQSEKQWHWTLFLLCERLDVWWNCRCSKVEKIRQTEEVIADTDATWRESEPFREDSFAIISRIKSQKPVQSELLFTSASFSAEHLFFVKSEIINSHEVVVIGLLWFVSYFIIKLMVSYYELILPTRKSPSEYIVQKDGRWGEPRLLHVLCLPSTGTLPPPL